MTPAPPPTVAAELPAKTNYRYSRPKKSDAKNQQKVHTKFSDLRDAALGANGTFTIPLLRLCPYSLSKSS
jgi:hypothetical protein